MHSDYVHIFDTTLRDGEQSPGASMTTPEKLRVARALARLGVDVIEAGFPAASPDDKNAVSEVARTVSDESGDGEPPVIAGLARATRGDIDACAEALEPATRPRIHVFIATSPIHREHKLRLSREDVLARAREAVAYARERADDVEFSPEDAGRTEPEFLYEVIEAAIEAGAGVINIPDTVGYTLPDEFGGIIANIRKEVRGADQSIISVHCHDDLGLAVANTLAGIRAGARQAEVTINGIGERAGNASLEEVVMALRARNDQFHLATGIETTELVPTSRLVSQVTGMTVQPNKAIVGRNAFAHEAGIHQDGILKHQETYEIISPDSVGAGSSKLVLGKHSGRHALRSRLTQLGHELDGEELDRAFARFKDLADRAKAVTDRDLLALIDTEIYEPEGPFTLDNLHIVSSTSSPPTATVTMTGPDGKRRVEAAVGSGPLEAAFRAIEAAVGHRCEVTRFQLEAVTEGRDALGEASVRVRDGRDSEAALPRDFHGHSADPDVLVASARAYVAAINRMLQSAPEGDIPVSMETAS